MDEPELIAGRYEVQRHLGTGGMGTVLLALDQRLRREVAIKRVHAGAGADSAQRIEREAKLGAGLTHPGLVTILDTIVEGASLLIVMEYVDGETLAERLSRGRLAPAAAIAVLRPVAAALDHAHGHGIVHRDVKPANVLLGQGGAVKLADLGVALADDVSRITREHAVIGSLHYMAPEQLEPKRVTAAADVYALAAIAYETLSGRRARDGHTPAELARVATVGAIPDLRDAAPDLPAEAAEVLTSGMARDPDQRPASATELIDRLETALAPAPTVPVAAAPTPPVTATHTPTPTPTPTPPPTPSPRPGRRRTPALLGVLALLLVVAGLTAAVLGGDGGEDPELSRADAPDSTATATEGGGSTTSQTGTPADGAAETSGPADPSTPTGAVRAFYELAAEDDLDGAWALAGPGMRAAFGDSQAQFEADLSSLESIRFDELTAGAEGPDGVPVTVATVARHETFTDRCTGDLLAVPDGNGGYLVDPASISCTSS